MLVIGKSRTDINFKDVIDTYELSIIPRSMFAQDGTLIHCLWKSAWQDIIIDYLPKEEQMNELMKDIVEDVTMEYIESNGWRGA